MKIELIKKDDRYAIRSKWFGVSFYWHAHYDDSGWWFGPFWYNKTDAETYFEVLIEAYKRDIKYKNSKVEVVKSATLV